LNAPQSTSRAALLRRDFDRSFAEAPREQPMSSIDLLAIGVCGDPYALRLSAVAGLFAGKKVTRLPGAAPELLGIVGFRGSVVPVYDLRVLLGYPAGDVPRWLLVAAASPAALGFDALEGYLQVPGERIAQSRQDEATRPHVHEVARVADSGTQAGVALLRPLVDPASIVAAIRQHPRRDLSTSQQRQQE
jgi:purine-binding chemotaxis protein CheW